jgi:hypothetical protein
MDLRRALLIAACVFPVAGGPAVAQFAPPPPQQQRAASPWDQPPQQAPWPQQQEPACIKEFVVLRDDAQKKAGAIRAASDHKATPKEACALFNSFAAAELKMIKYAQENAAQCGVPPQAVVQMKKQHVNTDNIRAKVCHAAAAGPPPSAAPSLSDALTAPIADSTNIKTGRGTFDTLTGTPLGGK